MNFLHYIFNTVRKSLTALPQAACIRLCDIDTWDIYDQLSMLQMGYNCADTQWNKRGYKLCFMCPRGE